MIEKWYSRAGCGFVLVLCLSTCLLLIVNSILVTASYNAVASMLPETAWLRHPRVSQALLFAGPVLLIIAEWWIYDLTVELARSSQSETPSDPDTTNRVR